MTIDQANTVLSQAVTAAERLVACEALAKAATLEAKRLRAAVLGDKLQGRAS